jgi:hypothetical protein
MDDNELARLLSQVEPKGRDVLRRLMRAEQGVANRVAYLIHGAVVEPW